MIYRILGSLLVIIIMVPVKVSELNKIPLKGTAK
jgi:hypothetical protein